MATSSKSAYAIPRSAGPRAPAPAADPCWPVPLQETLRHSKAGLALSLWGLLVCTRFCLSPLSISEGMEFDYKCDFDPATVLLEFLLCCWTWGIFMQQSPVDGCSAVSCNYGVLLGEGEWAFCYSAILCITRWSILKSDWLYSLQPKMKKLYTVSKNTTRSWLLFRSWTPYCKTQTEIEEGRENH